MLKPNDKIAIWMESSLDDDYGKMGISALRYLNNEILCVIDSVFAGKKIAEFKAAIIRLGGDYDGSQHFQKLDCFDSRIIFSPKELRNTISRRCVMIPIKTLAKVNSLPT